MPAWRQYSSIKELINEYFDIKQGDKYDEFIKKLTEILDVQERVDEALPQNKCDFSDNPRIYSDKCDFNGLSGKCNRQNALGLLFMKMLAPFGEYLSKQIDRKDALNVAIIFMGQFAFERALSFQGILPYTLALPPNSSPKRFDWPVKNCEVYLCDTGFSDWSFVRFCALIFFGYGATRVRYISRKDVLDIEKGVSQ